MGCPRCGSTRVSASGRCGNCGALDSSSVTVLTPAVAVPAPTAADAETVLADQVSQTPPGARPGPPIGPLNAGQSFGTRYHIIKALGAGGMGVVYQAWDAELGVAVALKVIRPEVLLDPGSAGEVERRFKRELVLARQVTHKHVVRIHDLGELQGIKYLTMPFVEGENLADVLKRDGKVSVPRAIAIAKEVASGLGAAHEVGVVHRDLKPENIMISADGHALIMDFGISRSVGGTGTATALGAVMGTLEYMAPEQAQGQAVDHRADIYSFGLVLYDMLTGRQRIARRENAMSEMMSRMQHAPPSVRSLDSHVPETLDRIIAKCLQSDPKSRYATTADLVADLEALAPDGHRLVPAHPVTASRTTVLIAAAIIATTLAAAGWWIWHTRGRAIPLVQQEPVSVLIANFDNRANEPLFDGLIEQALGVGIEGTSFVTTYPRRDALRVLEQQINNANVPLDEGNARLVARREGIKRIVSGSIAANGSKYALAVKVLDVEGKPLMTWDTTASDRNDVLNAVGRLAAKVRRGLGDASANADQIKEAETFTAASIEAAHEYVQAQELQAAGQYREALEGYNRALVLDPKLGRAYAGLGAVSNSMLKRDEAIGYYKQALGLIDRMTDREKFRTRGGYYASIGDYEKAKEQYEALFKQYPADTNALSNLAVIVANQRDMTRALELGRKASAFSSNNVLRRNNVALFAMYAGNFEVAEKQAKDVLGLNNKYVKAYLVVAMAQLGTGRPAEAEATWQELGKISSVGRDLAALGRADLALYEGRLADAASVLEGALAKPAEGRTPLTTARLTVTLAEVRALQGRGADAARLAEQALTQSDYSSISLFAGRAFIAAGKPERGDEIAARLDQRLDQVSQADAKLLTGEAALQRGNARAAITQFNAAQKILDTWLGRDGLGRAYLAAGYFPDAQTEFDACMTRKGEATTVLIDDIPTYRLFAATRYYIARVQEGQNSPAAAGSYKAFLSIKEKGDEQGLVVDARRRIAALK
jgi:eukaryotic-like serine/threonine-protein kinase